MPLEICRALRSEAAPDHAFVRLDAIAFQGDAATLTLRLMDHNEATTWQRWKVTTGLLIDHEIHEPWGDLEVNGADHVLARQHSDPVQELTFRGNAGSAAEVVGNLLAAHNRVASGWIPFARYLNGAKETGALLAAGFGKLAQGPAFLMETYAAVLREHGMNANLHDPRPSRTLVKGQWTDVPGKLSVLQIGDSFFVSEMFDDERLSDE